MASYDHVLAETDTNRAATTAARAAAKAQWEHERQAPAS